MATTHIRKHSQSDNRKKLFKDSDSNNPDEGLEQGFDSVSDIYKGFWGTLYCVEKIDGQPHKLVGFGGDGYPISLIYNKNGVEVRKITVRGIDAPLGSVVKVIANERGERNVLVGSTVYPIDDFVSAFSYPSDRANLTDALKALDVTAETFSQPYFYVEDSHVKWHGKLYTSSQFPYQEEVVSNLKIAEVPEEVLRELFALFKPYPKELTLLYATLGIPLINVVRQYAGLGGFNIVLDAVGSRDSGKTYTEQIGLKLFWGLGFDYSVADDALATVFRFSSLAGSTDLPIFCDEARMDEEKFKTLAAAIRGTKDLRLKIFKRKATFFLSRNSRTASKNPEDAEGEDKRFARYYFDDTDMIPVEHRNKGEELRRKLKDMGGGLAFDILKEKTIEKLLTLWEQTTGSLAERGAKFGAVLLGNNDFSPIVSNEPSIDPLELFKSQLKLIIANLDSAEFKLPYNVAEIERGFLYEIKDGGFEVTIMLTVARRILKGLDIDESVKTFCREYHIAYSHYSFSGIMDVGMRLRIDGANERNRKSEKELNDLFGARDDDKEEKDDGVG